MTARLQADGVTVDVEHVPAALDAAGNRGDRVYVRIRPTGAEPGRDNGPRTCIAMTPADAHALGVMLQQATAANATEGH